LRRTLPVGLNCVARVRLEYRPPICVLLPVILMHVGGRVAPYGTSLMFDNVRIEIIAPATLAISYGATTFNISSSTPKGVYTSNGETITQIK